MIVDESTIQQRRRNVCDWNAMHMLAGKSMANLMRKERTKQALANATFTNTEQMVKAVLAVFHVTENESHVMGMNAKLSGTYQQAALDWDAQMDVKPDYLREMQDADTAPRPATARSGVRLANSP